MTTLQALIDALGVAADLAEHTVTLAQWRTLDGVERRVHAWLARIVAALQPTVLDYGDPTSAFDAAVSSLASARDELGPHKPVDWDSWVHRQEDLGTFDDAAARMRWAAACVEDAGRTPDSVPPAHRRAVDEILVCVLPP